MSELTLQKITEKTVANVLKSDAHVLVSQTDTVGGNSMETLRRVPVDTIVADLKEIVEEDVADLKSAIGYSGEEETEVDVDISSLIDDNHFWNSESTEAVLTSYSGYCAYDAISVSEGELYKVTIFRQSSRKQHAVLLTNDNLTILESYGQGTGSTDGVEVFNFAVPVGATKMLLTTQSGKTPIVKKTANGATLNSVPELIERIDDLESADDAFNLQIGEIEDDADELRDAIGYTEGDTEEQIDITSLINDNHFWNSETETAVLASYNGYCAYNALSVQVGDTYTVRIFRQSSKKQHAVLLVDDNMAIIESYGKGTGTTDGTETYTFTIPSGVTKMLLTTKSLTSPLVKRITHGEQLNSIPGLIHRVDSLSSVLKGKKVAIIGDSISTNGNTGIDSNVPEIIITEDDIGVQLSAYLTYYDVQAELSLGGHTFTSSEIGTEITFTPTAADVGKSIGAPLNYNPNSTTVWWEIMQEALGNSTIPVCWSGASITSHEDSSNQYKTSYAWHDAQIRKCGIRTPGSMTRTAPDMIIIYRGTNDFSHSSYAKLTEGYFDSENWQYPENDAVTGGYGYLEGLALTIKKLREAYPNTQIYLCTLNVFKRINYSHFPTNNGQNTLPKYNNAIRKAADFFGCGLIEFDKDGITFENCYSGGYITDSSTTPTHPSNKGHAVMGRKAIADIRAQFNEL